jgi:serine/threonine-protein kinase TNNI3K
MQRPWTQSSLVLVALACADASVATMDAVQVFSRGACTGMTDTLAMMTLEQGCEDSTCKAMELGDDAYNISVHCNISDRFDYAADVFDDNPYVFIETYDQDTSCNSANRTLTNVYPASGECLIDSTEGTSSVIVSLYPNGSLDMLWYDGDRCSGKSKFNFTLSSADVAKGGCLKRGFKVYSSISLNEGEGSSTSESGASVSGSSSSSNPNVNITSSSGSAFIIANTGSASSGISGGAIAGIVVAVLVVICVVIGFLWYRRRTNKKCEGSSPDKPSGAYAQLTSPTTGQKSTDTGITDFSSSLGLGPQSLAGLWDDEVIAAWRIPREKVLMQHLINRGWYGEVYDGLYNGQRVALKMLLPDLRKSVKHVAELLDEVRLIAHLEHPRIVGLVGISWDSLSDLCVVLEFMEGGDLRELLASYESDGRDVGFDRSKVTIALHVAHALTYLHSLDPPVLHRDLKSKNILLTSDLQAKVTDFGISRERGDRTMTAGVGTSLWMAPEVMMGERYDAKADVFSFGVVLSELDQHTLPYSQATDSSGSGRKLPDTAILQMVAMGQLRVVFSPGALDAMVSLGNSCVALDPTHRPTAAEALYQLQLILQQAL